MLQPRWRSRVRTHSPIAHSRMIREFNCWRSRTRCHPWQVLEAAGKFFQAHRLIWPCISLLNIIEVMLLNVRIVEWSVQIGFWPTPNQWSHSSHSTLSTSWASINLHNEHITTSLEGASDRDRTFLDGGSQQQDLIALRSCKMVLVIRDHMICLIDKRYDFWFEPFFYMRDMMTSLQHLLVLIFIVFLLLVISMSSILSHTSSLTKFLPAISRRLPETYHNSTQTITPWSSIVSSRLDKRTSFSSIIHKLNQYRNSPLTTLITELQLTSRLNLGLQPTTNLKVISRFYPTEHQQFSMLVMHPKVIISLTKAISNLEHASLHRKECCSRHQRLQHRPCRRINTWHQHRRWQAR